MNFFSPDSKFTQFMTAFGEMVILNLCWIIGCLPVVTVGASNAALYTVMRRRVLEEESTRVIAPFFIAWWNNIKQGSLFWVVQLLMSCSLGSFFILPMPGFMKVVAGSLLGLVTLVFSLIYPQVARFRNRWFAYVRNAIILVVLRLRFVLLNFVLVLSPVILFLLAPYDFLKFGVIWFLGGVALIFFLSAKLMQKILQPLEEMVESKSK